MSDTNSQIYFADTKAKAVFAADGPKPQFIFDTPNFKALVVGLEAGGQIPVHPGEAAMYHFLEGVGLMTVGDEAFEVKPGVTVVVPSGAKRGMKAKTRVVFLGQRAKNRMTKIAALLALAIGSMSVLAMQRQWAAGTLDTKCSAGFPFTISSWTFSR